jgi:hypothetical protein
VDEHFAYRHCLGQVENVLHVTLLICLPGALRYNAGAGSAYGRILDARQRKYAFSLSGTLLPLKLRSSNFDFKRRLQTSTWPPQPSSTPSCAATAWKVSPRWTTPVRSLGARGDVLGNDPQQHDALVAFISLKIVQRRTGSTSTRLVN